MPEYIRVTDEVKPRREYSIVASTFDPDFQEKLDKPATQPDGTPLPPKYTPADLVKESGGEGYAGMGVEALKEEIERRNADRPEEQRLKKSGKKGDLVERLEADDDAQLLNQPDEPLGDEPSDGDLDADA